MCLCWINHSSFVCQKQRITQRRHQRSYVSGHVTTIEQLNDVTKEDIKWLNTNGYVSGHVKTIEQSNDGTKKRLNDTVHMAMSQDMSQP